MLSFLASCSSPPQAEPDNSQTTKSSENSNLTSKVNEEATSRSEFEENSPEGVLRRFLIAMLTGDKESLFEAALPHEDLAVLISHEVTQSQLESARETIETMPWRHLKIGDEFQLPSGATVVVDDKMVTDDRKVVTFPGNLIPLKVVRQDGRWFVDAETIIVVRKAAERLRGR